MTQDELDLDRHLVTRYLAPRKVGESLYDAINRIIEFDIQVALDPAVSEEATKLQDTAYEKGYDAGYDYAQSIYRNDND